MKGRINQVEKGIIIVYLINVRYLITNKQTHEHRKRSETDNNYKGSGECFIVEEFPQKQNKQTKNGHLIRERDRELLTIDKIITSENVSNFKDVSDGRYKY